MVKFTVLLFSIALVSCGYKDRYQVSKQTKTDLTESIDKISDTLRDPDHYYFCSDVDPKLFAKWILIDSVIPSDNFSTFRVMDSLESKRLEDRKFYFNVFLNIKKKADGALGEAIGSPAFSYTKNHTKEFLEFSSELTKEEFESWAYDVGVEIFLSSNGDPTKDAQDYFKKLKSNCLNCTVEEKELLERFNTAMKQGIIENEE